MAASELHIPTAVHESNAVPGLTTKQLAGHVDRIMLGLEDSKKYYKQQERVVVTGTPVRGAFACYTKDSAKRSWVSRQTSRWLFRSGALSARGI